MNFLPPDYGRLGDYEFVRALSNRTSRILLPDKNDIHPHQNALRWHRDNVFSLRQRLGGMSDEEAGRRDCLLNKC